MATFYPPFNLKRFKKNLARLYLLCYVHQRFFKVNDHLTTFFSYRTSKFYQDGEQFAKDQLYREREQAEERYVKAGKMIKLFSDKRLANDDLRPSAFQIVPEEKINKFATDLTSYESKKSLFIWQYLEKQSRSIKINLRPVFQAIAFKCEDNEPISNAVKFLKSQINSGRPQNNYPIKDVPMEFIPKTQWKHVIEKIPDSNDAQVKISVKRILRISY